MLLNYVLSVLIEHFANKMCHFWCGVLLFEYVEEVF